jgi:N utilization substance protein B
VYAFYKGDKREIARAEEELHLNIRKSYDLYHALLLLIIDLFLYAESRMELARNKLVPSAEDLNPNTRFIDNRVIHQIRHNEQLLRYVEKEKLSWVNYPELVRELYNEMIATDAYKEYMTCSTCDYSDDRKFVLFLYTHIILPNENLEQSLEEQSIYWNDDIEFCVSMIVKTLKKFNSSNGNDNGLMGLYKNTEDEDFAVNLLRKTLVKRDEYLSYIKTNTRNWDVERIAFMDILIMQMAIAELVGFSSIPTKVTLNEYLEIAKSYSTQKSNVFINGVLDKVVADLRKDQLIKKAGRGLIGEIDSNENEP